MYFRIYDKEGNGYISTDTLKEILKELDNKVIITKQVSNNQIEPLLLVYNNLFIICFKILVLKQDIRHIQYIFINAFFICNQTDKSIGQFSVDWRWPPEHHWGGWRGWFWDSGLWRVHGDDGWINSAIEIPQIFINFPLSLAAIKYLLFKNN